MRDSRLLHAWRAWRGKALLLAPFRKAPQGMYFSPELRFEELRSTATSGKALAPYEGMASFWHRYSRTIQADYASFLRHLARSRSLPIRSVLDLACGTGTLAEQLAGWAPQVLGVDASRTMLAQAQSRLGALPGVRFLEADFRSFQVDQGFDAAICACNALNYIKEYGELTTIFRAVSQHLRPGGLFLFDTITERGMCMLSNLYLHSEIDGVRFVLQFAYDQARRRMESKALLPEGVETHQQIPIDPSHVLDSARESGLKVEDYFSAALIPGRLHIGESCFYVLAKPS